MHTLPKRALAVACAAALLGTGTSALAAESVPASAPSTGISVQLDGRNLSFPDAAPEARDGRTFLPVRTVFEAMGAEVSYSPAAQTITAVRDGTTVTMALGGTAATVERSGVTTHIPMDAAPYAHDNRTYVPVRFAAQAFGCAVGWDRTVILIDMEKLVEETLSKYDFTYLEKYLAYGQKYRTGIWDMNADFDASLDMTGLLLGSTAESAPIILDGTLEGVMAGGAKMDAAMGLTMDLRPFLKALTDGQNGGMSASDTELLDALAEEGIHMELRGDLEAGQLYISLGGAFLEQAAGLPADTWYSMDMGALFEQLGMDYAELMDLSKTLDASVMLEAMLQSADLSDKDTAYATVAGLVDSAAKLLSDEGFQKNGSDYTTAYTYTQDGADMTLSFTLNTKNDKVVGYAMDIKMTMVTGAETGETTEVMTMTMGMDEKNHMTAEMKMDLLGLMSMNMTISGDYKTTDKTPAVEPPAGAVVVPFEELGMETAAPETAA